MFKIKIFDLFLVNVKLNVTFLFTFDIDIDNGGRDFPMTELYDVISENVLGHVLNLTL